MAVIQDIQRTCNGCMFLQVTQNVHNLMASDMVRDKVKDGLKGFLYHCRQTSVTTSRTRHQFDVNPTFFIAQIALL